MVRLVVEDDDAAPVAERAADAACHLVGRLLERIAAILSTGEDLPGDLRHTGAVAEQEAVEVGDDDARLTQAIVVAWWDQVALAVVVVRALREQDAQAVPDR